MWKCSGPYSVSVQTFLEADSKLRHLNFKSILAQYRASRKVQLILDHYTIRAKTGRMSHPSRNPKRARSPSSRPVPVSPAALPRACSLFPRYSSHQATPDGTFIPYLVYHGRRTMSNSTWGVAVGLQRKDLAGFPNELRFTLPGLCLL